MTREDETCFVVGIATEVNFFWQSALFKQIKLVIKLFEPTRAMGKKPKAVFLHYSSFTILMIKIQTIGNIRHFMLWNVTNFRYQRSILSE